MPQRADDGTIVVDGTGQPVLVDGGDAPRWVGSGWTVFDNKGKAVRSFEPFFSDTHAFDADARIGVSPWRCYDPLGRVVATLRPDHTVEKVVFDAWQQANYDANDTTLNADGSTDFTADPDIGRFIARLPATDCTPTWYEQRIALPVDDPQRVAAERAAVHRQTPAIAHLDAMGRTYLTIAQNRFVRSGVTVEESYTSRIELDIEGNHRSVGDPNGRIAARYDYDMLGNRIHQSSMDAGERWTVADVTGKLIRAWDSRLRARLVEYDDLRRPLSVFVTENGVKRLVEQTVYGEGQGVAGNHRTRVYQSYDSAGVTTTVTYDFKGNALETQRHVLSDHRTPVDWQAAPVLDGTAYSIAVTYDAMNRRRTVTTPDASVYRPTFTEGNLLQSVAIDVRGGAQTSLVDNIDYDAKGQRVRIDYGNGSSTSYDHDPLTWRLIHARTTRPAAPDATASSLFIDPSVVADLHYTYDPVGNVSTIADGAASTVFFDNQVVAPGSGHVYDATYRLIESSGREHVGQNAFAPTPASRRDFDLAGLADLVAHPNDAGALRTYTERYEYDAADNLTAMRHVAGTGSWTRTYDYSEASPLELGKQSNRLTSTTVGARVEAYGYIDAQGNDANGCITGVGSMTLDWDANDHLATADLGGGGTAYYAYDATGRRVRKVVDDQNGNPQSETIYVGTYEVHHTFGVNASTRESLHVMDDTQRIALIETDTGAASVLRYQVGDHLGSSAIELDDAAALISYEEYHPFGTSSFQAGRSAAEVSLKRYRFTGDERDEETGFDYHRARYCAPWLGRWMSADPAGLVDGPNLYRYARNNPVRLTDPSGTDPPRVDQPSPRVTSILTDVTVVSGNELISDHSVSGTGTIGLRARTGLLLDVPQLNLHTSGLATGTATVDLDTSHGRAGVVAQGGVLLGDLNGFNLSMVGSGSLRTTVPERIQLGSLSDTLTAGLPTAEGNLRLHGELASGRTSLLRFDADASLANGAFGARLDGTSIANVGRLHGSVTGHFDPGGSVTLDSAQLRASATIPGLSLAANARGVGDGRGGLNVTADASVRLFGLQSLRAQGTGNVSANGASIAGTFSGPGPLYSSYILGDFNLNTRGGNTVNATVLGLGYTPGLDLDGPASPPPGSGAEVAPKAPWQPSGLSLGVTRFNYSRENLNYLSIGVFPDLSSNLFRNFQVGVVYKQSF